MLRNKNGQEVFGCDGSACAELREAWGTSLSSNTVISSKNHGQTREEAQMRAGRTVLPLRSQGGLVSEGQIAGADVKQPQPGPFNWK